ncbi:MAG TPA: VWA domain-containing protein [Polyangiaceae bacterium]|nr:VWA domain-containing protein [Polyangiaceae bacterium]
MVFAGLPLAQLLMIAGGAASVTVLLYVLKLRRRAVPVPFARIWDAVFRDRQATELFSKLRRLLSLLFQLALLALLVIALGDPKPKQSLLEGRHLVILVDGSASMKAIDVKPSRIDAAKTQVKKLVRGLGSADRALIVQMGSLPSPLSTMSSDVTELDPAIDSLRASDTRADLERGLSFAIDSLRGLPKAEIVVVSDGVLGDVAAIASHLDLGKASFAFLPVGKSGSNLAISEFSVRRYPLDKSRSEVMLEVANTNDQAAQVELTLLGDGAIIDVSRFALGANERLPRYYPDLAGASHTLEAKIRFADGHVDDLPADDHAYALMPERHRARVLVISKGNTYLEAALLLDEYLDVTSVLPGKPIPSAHFDVAILDGVADPLPDSVAAALYLNPPEGGVPLKLGARLSDFGFDTWDKKSPILRFLALGDVQVADGHALSTSSGDRVLGASDQGPILVAGARSGHPFVALGFDPRNSDWVLRVAWPLFVLNTINAFVEEDTSYVSSFRTGEVWRIPAPSSVDSATVTDPHGAQHVVPVKEGRAVYLGEEAGFYKMSAGSGNDVVQSEFAANLSDLSESRITPVSELAIGKRKAGRVSIGAPGSKRQLWVYLLAVVVGLSVLEWITYHRRITV